MASNYISSLISMSRGVNKIAKGDKIAILTTLGHATKVVEKAAKIDTNWGHTAASVIDGFTKAAEGNVALQAVSKGLRIAKKGDAIGMVMSGINAVKSNTPARNLIEDGCGWATKFLAKGLILNYGSKLCNIKGIKPIADSISNFSKNTKGFGQLNNVIAGCAYSASTIYGFKAGKSIGKFICDKLNLPPKESPAQIVEEQRIPLR